LHVIILAGGYATRLRPLTLTRPKALLPVLDRPLLDWIFEGVTRGGAKRISLSLHHMYDIILKHAQSVWGDTVSIDHYIEEIPLGDAGPILEIEENLGIDFPVVVIYGDIFSSIDVGKVYSFHRSRGGVATVVITRVDDVKRYGVVKVDRDSSRVVDFVEKPLENGGGYINAGIYVFEREVLRYIEKGRKQGIGRDLMPKLIKAGDVYAYIHEGIWNDVGVPGDYIKANIDALSLINKEKKYISPKSSVSESAEITPPVYIGDGVYVEDSATIGGGAVIMRGSKIMRGALVLGSLLMSRVIVGQSASVINSIIGEGSYIGKWSRISRRSIVGDGVYIGDTTCLGEGTIVLPYKDLSSEDLCGETNKIIL